MRRARKEAGLTLPEVTIATLPRRHARRSSSDDGFTLLEVSIPTLPRRHARRSSSDDGFTLLEVMIALAILAMSLITLSSSYQNSVRAANRSRLMTEATLLARYKMVEVEEELFKEGFSDFEEEEKGDFKDEDFDRFEYVLKVEKVELPKSVDPQDATDMMGSSGSSSSSSSESGTGSPMDALGGGLLASYYDMIRQVLEKSIRRVQLSVHWKEGAIKREVTVVSYFTDDRVIGAAVSGQISPANLGSTSSSGSTTGGSTSPSGPSTTPSVNTGTLR